MTRPRGNQRGYDKNGRMCEYVPTYGSHSDVRIEYRRAPIRAFLSLTNSQRASISASYKTPDAMKSKRPKRNGR